MYWVYRSKTYMWHNQYVMAQIVEPPTQNKKMPYGIQSPLQLHPYETSPHLTFHINPKHPHPDFYSSGSGFRLFSKRLVDLMSEYEVRFESFPVTMVNKDGQIQQDLDHYIFHSLEGLIDAMDKEASGWQGSAGIGVPRLILDPARFEHRPIFICADVYVDLMRDDLRQEIDKRNMTGFEFFKPEDFTTGRYGVLQRRHS